MLPAKPLNGYIFLKFLSARPSTRTLVTLLYRSNSTSARILLCVWHHNLTNVLSLQIKTIQKRAIRIIFECTRDMPYRSALYYAGPYRRYTAVEQTRRAASFSPSCSQTRAFMYCSRPQVILIFFPDYEIHECIRQHVTELKSFNHL